jgi:mono/diheme cytochrome c family protein
MSGRAGLVFGVCLSLLAAACGSEGETGLGSTTAAAMSPSVGAGGIPEDDPAAGAEPAASADWEMPVPTLAYNAREGRTVFLHYCAPCHGEGGHGDGFNAYNLDPRPRDLSDPEFQASRTDEDLIAVVRSGGGVAGLSNGMPPWGRTLNEHQIHNVVVLLRTLEPEEEE